MPGVRSEKSAGNIDYAPPGPRPSGPRREGAAQARSSAIGPARVRALKKHLRRRGLERPNRALATSLFSPSPIQAGQS